MHTIESGIPIPSDTRTRGPERVYPFADMQVGQSIFVEGDKKSESVKNARSAASAYARRYESHSFTTRYMENGLRIWRIASNQEATAV